MSSISRWKKLFGRTGKPTFKVLVGEATEEMTDTQAYRFDELTHAGPRDSRAASSNPLEQPVYSLAEAAFRLMSSEEDLLHRAAAGSIRLFTNAAGFTGRWRRVDTNGETVESSARILSSGYLALTILSCKELSLSGASSVLVFEYPLMSDPSVLNFEAQTLQELSAWGGRKKNVLCE